MMDDDKQLAQRIEGAVQSASQEVTNLRSELTATSRRLAELGAADRERDPPIENHHQQHIRHHHHHHHGNRDGPRESVWVREENECACNCLMCTLLHVWVFVCVSAYMGEKALTRNLRESVCAFEVL